MTAVAERLATVLGDRYRIERERYESLRRDPRRKTTLKSSERW